MFSENEETEHEDLEALREIKKQQQKEKMRVKRRRYKRGRKDLTKALSRKPKSPGEQMFINMVNSIEDKQVYDFDLDVVEYSNKLNMMTHLYCEFTKDGNFVEM